MAPEARPSDGPGPSGGTPFPVDHAAYRVLRRLWDAGHAAYVVGGAVRDALLGRETHDWDVATGALPEQLLSIFPAGHYENRFGTVLVDGVEVTTFRRDHRYRDHRRPDEVTFTDDPVADLARRDFTVNAIAWGRPSGLAAGTPGFHGTTGERPGAGPPGFLDPTGGRGDLAAGLLRAVGDPDARFDEDALRLLRAARIAATVGLTIEPRTFAAMRAHAADVGWVSGERVGIEVRRMLGAQHPSAAFRTLAEAGILAVLFPELDAQRGLPQAKIPGHDLWDHTLATLDAIVGLAPGDEVLALAALLHDAGKPGTLADGHFIGHPEAGARIARDALRRIAYPVRETDRIARLIEEHMFQYLPAWSDAAVRRFMRRVGPDLVDDLLLLRGADNAGSGVPVDAGHLDELRRRVAAERRAGAPLALGDLVVDGHDVMAAVGRPPGPWLGALLDRLLESVLADPSRNTRDVLLADARHWASHESDGPDGRAAAVTRP